MRGGSKGRAEDVLSRIIPKFGGSGILDAAAEYEDLDIQLECVQYWNKDVDKIFFKGSTP